MALNFDPYSVSKNVKSGKPHVALGKIQCPNRLVCQPARSKATGTLELLLFSLLLLFEWINFKLHEKRHHGFCFLLCTLPYPQSAMYPENVYWVLFNDWINKQTDKWQHQASIMLWNETLVSKFFYESNSLKRTENIASENVSPKPVKHVCWMPKMYRFVNLAHFLMKQKIWPLRRFQLNDFFIVSKVSCFNISQWKINLSPCISTLNSFC